MTTPAAPDSAAHQLMANLVNLGNQGNQGKESGDASITQFLNRHSCYDLLAVSGKVVVLDERLPIKKAFQALHQNGIEVAPVWSLASGAMKGPVAVHQFLLMTHQLYTSFKRHYSMDAVVQELDGTTLADLLDRHEQDCPMPFVAASTTLLDTVRLIVQAGTHSVQITVDPSSAVKAPPVQVKSADPGAGEAMVADTPPDPPRFQSILSVLHAHRLVRFIAVNFPNVDQWSAQAGDVASMTDLITASPKSSVIELVRMLLDHKVHCIPIVDEDGCVLDVFERSDVMRWIPDGFLFGNLDISVSDLLSNTAETVPRIHVCQRTTRLSAILNTVRMSHHQAIYRFFVTETLDEEPTGRRRHRLLGILSILDILRYLVRTLSAG